MPYLQCSNVEIYYEHMGSGSPVLFLHSGFNDTILHFIKQS